MRDAVYARIDEEWERVTSAWEERSGRAFPCGPGCSPNCCEVSIRGMPYVPLPMSASEAEVLRGALRSLPLFQREKLIRRRIKGHHHSCLLLLDGRCLVYEARPLWCRVYGLWGSKPICGRIPLEAGWDAQWMETVKWAFGEVRSEQVVFIPDLISAL